VTESNSNISEADKLAQRCAQYMYENDAASQALGIKLTQVHCGSAIAVMEVKDFMLNGHKTCHGGQIFTLADSAFAFACNSQNQAAVALSCTIDFVNPAFENDTLTATAEELHQGGRSGVYQIKITNQNQQLIALFKGNSARIKRSVLPEESMLPDTK
jgi:acyl-CoA thioesterase